MKNLIALILLIILPLLANSQTPSNDSTCCVPCKSLKKALLVKTERDYLKEQIGVARDSIVILSRIVLNQDSVIIKQDTTISLYKKNEEEYTQIVKNKDTEIEIKDKQIKKAKNRARIAWVTTGASAIAFIILLL
jgi:hypothetical protein